MDGPNADRGYKMKLEIKKLYHNSILPYKAHGDDAGFDLFAHSFASIKDGKCIYIDDDDQFYDMRPGERIMIKTGIGMAIPVGYEAQIRPRSGLALKHGITVVNSPGTIDAGFRAEVGVILLNTGKYRHCIEFGDRIAQMVIQKLPEVTIEIVDELSPSSDRGCAGFGSTGVK